MLQNRVLMGVPHISPRKLLRFLGGTIQENAMRYILQQTCFKGGSMEEQRAIQLLQEVMAIPSVNGRDEEGKVAEYLCAYFQNAGISAAVERIDETHANVTAVLEGDPEGGRMIWNGHLDTVPYGAREDWDTDPALPVTEGKILYGRGASDMKSGLCAMVYALCEYKRSGKRPACSVLFLGTCDEEKGGLGAERVCQKGENRGYSQYLIGEPTGLRLGMAQKGCIWLELSLHGKTSHGAYPEQGVSGVEHGIFIAHQLKAWVETFSHPLLGNSTANITQISGGTACNMIPERCDILMDIRITPGVSVEDVTKKAEELIAEEQRKTEGLLQVEYQLKNNRRAIEAAEDAPMVRKLKACMEKEGILPKATGISFFTDASIMVRDQPEAQVLLFGPGEPSMAHKPNEWVDLDHYRKAIRVLERFLEE